MKLPPRHRQLLADLLDAPAKAGGTTVLDVLPDELVHRIDALLEEQDVPERPRRQHELVIHVASDNPLPGSAVMDSLDGWLDTTSMDVTGCASTVTPTSALHVAVFVDTHCAQGEGYRTEHRAWQERVVADRDS